MPVTSELRRSTLVGIFGPGSIVDLRTPGGAALSGIVPGLEAWDDVARNKGLLHRQVTHEPRLQKRLFVDGFRLPPVRASEATDSFDILEVVRFPRWLQCSRCQRLRDADDWSFRPGSPERFCQTCSDLDSTQVFVVPVRFIIACDRGHIDEFPWQWWIGCHCQRPQLTLKTEGAGLAGKVVFCAGCEERRSLDGVFNKFALKEFRCTGHRPWLSNADEQCPRVPRALQRGASNVYWDATMSALDIPPFSLDLADVFGRYSSKFEGKSPEDARKLIELLDLSTDTGLTVEQLMDYLEHYQRALDADVSPRLEPAEYEQLDAACGRTLDEGEFRVRPMAVPPELDQWISGLALADRLREVRALTGFTRIHPPSGPFRDNNARVARLSARSLRWLPAIELLGEGIFIRLNLDAVDEWERRADVRERTDQLVERIRRDLKEDETLPDCPPRLLLIHSLAHVLIRQLSLECGYNSAALRERIYVDSQHSNLCGLLIHTGSPDSEGTLGGLVAQGNTDRFYDLMRGALAEASWCSQDPICITGTATLSSPRNAAACHACLLVPETCCQFFNLLLDRAMLVGRPDAPELGFFSGFVKQLHS
jgi:hypothetical protein